MKRSAILTTVLFALNAQPTLADLSALQSLCAETELNAGSTFGEANFVGEPWTYSWTTTTEWDDAARVWRDTDPVVHSLPILGQALQVVFEDNSLFTYGDDLPENKPLWGDNLFSIATYAMQGQLPPYLTAHRPDGSIVLLDEICDEKWFLQRSTH